MACPEVAALCFVAGDTIEINWQYTASDGETPIDLTGATAQMQLLDKITDLVQVVDMTGGLTDPVSGTGSFSLTNVQSQALLPVGSGDNDDSIKFVSVVLLTFADTTTKTIAGIRVEIEQGGIR